MLFPHLSETQLEINFIHTMWVVQRGISHRDTDEKWRTWGKSLTFSNVVITLPFDFPRKIVLVSHQLSLVIALSFVF